MTRVLFFDIDGTILSEVTHTIPESCKAAIAKAKANGHYVFINTGRTSQLLPGQLEELLVDGYLCGCGVHITFRDQILRAIHVSYEETCRLIDLMNRCNIDGILEGTGQLYVSNKTNSRFPEYLRIVDQYNINAKKPRIYWEDKVPFEFDKFVVFTDGQSDKGTFFDAIKEQYFIIDRQNDFYEIVPKPYTKAEAISFILDYLKLPLSAAVVFGDSSNDLPMFELVPEAVAMEAHDPVLDPYTSFVTKTVEADGIEFAMKHLGII